ncbi:hypothetical protein R1sor_011571 [Riccia sorocarpa]|uniref:Uncharacterized protein n=1 Tax=Riccia sorocarpa TaxID=122646 RepID=A0ABD3I4X2_9MARC
MEAVLVNLIPESAVTVEGRTEMAGAATTPKSGQVKKTVFRLKDHHYAHICDYLETDDHFAEIYGSARKTKVGGKNQSKATAFGHMAVDFRRLGWPLLSGAAVGKKVERYADSYKKALTFYNGTGSGLTEEEVQAGMSMDGKMNTKCPHFFRMNALFGARPNVAPPALCTMGIPSDENEIFLDSQIDCGARDEYATENTLADEEEEDDEEDGLIEVVDGGSTEPEEMADHQEVDKDSLPDTIDVSSHRAVPVEGQEVLPPQQGAPKTLGNSRPAQKQKELRQGRGSMAVLFQATVKQKAEYRTAALEAKDRFRLALLEEKRRERETKEATERETAKRARIDKRNSMIFDLYKSDSKEVMVSARKP